MFQSNFPTRRSLTVTTIADDISTLEGLERYLHARVSFRAVTELEGAVASVAASDAVVLYPDGFAPNAVQHFVRHLIGNTSLSLVIVVTGQPERFRALSDSRATANRFIVLLRPVWPWELLATIQAGLPYPGREHARSC